MNIQWRSNSLQIDRYDPCVNDYTTMGCPSNKDVWAQNEVWMHIMFDFCPFCELRYGISEAQEKIIIEFWFCHKQRICKIWLVIIFSEGGKNDVNEKYSFQNLKKKITLSLSLSLSLYICIYIYIYIYILAKNINKSDVL